MSILYTVQEGEHLSKIAKKFGFRSFRAIWSDPNNAALAATRTSPNVLLPGDVIFIPDREPRREEANTGRRHTFFTTNQRLRLRLVVKDPFDTPMKGMSIDVDVDGDVAPLITSNDGQVERPIPIDAERGQISVLGVVVPVRIGHLNPVDHVSGWMARLNNLGYHAGEVGQSSPEEVRSAVEEFQCDFGLPVTGLVDGATQAALVSAHGC